MDNDDFIKREREFDARKREAFLKQQAKNDVTFTESGSTHSGPSMIKGDIGSSWKTKIGEFGSKFKEAMPKRMTDEELEEKTMKTHKKAALAEAEARLARAKSSKSRSGGSRSSVGRVYKEVTDAFSQMPAAQGFGGSDLSGYLAGFEAAPKQRGRRSRQAAPDNDLDMSGYLQNFMPGPAPKRSGKRRGRSDDLIGQYFY